MVPDDRERRDLFRSGQYKVFAFASTTENFAAFDREWLRLHESGGVAVEALKNGNVSLDLLLNTQP